MKKAMKDEEEPTLLTERLRAYIDLLRPFTLLPPLIAGIFISMTPLLMEGQSILAHWDTLIYVGVTLALLQGAGQVINQSYPEEVEIDKENGKDYRPIPSGKLTVEEGMGLGIILVMFGLLRAFTVNTTFGVLAVVIAFFSIFYTYPPVRAKKRFIFNVLWLGISRGFLPVIACFAIFDGIYTLTPLVWGFIGFIWVSGFNVVKDMPDVKGDRAHDIPSIPVRIGQLGTVMHTIAFACVFILVSNYSITHYLPLAFSSLRFVWLPATAIPITLYFGFKVPKLENNLSWVLFYSGLALLFLVPPITMLL